MIENIIEKPYPKMLIMNFNWSSVEIKSVELLQTYLSLCDGIKLNNLFSISKKDLHSD